MLVLVAGLEGPGLTLTPAEDMEDCRARMARVTTILRGAGMDILAARCGLSDLRLTPFMHGAPPEESRWRYRVTLEGADGFVVRPLPDDAPCAPSDRVYCATSSQRPPGEGQEHR